MSRELTQYIIKNPQAFIDEIVRNHGTDSTQYIMATSMIREIEYQLTLINKERTV
jgi:hypothetical protein